MCFCFTSNEIVTFHLRNADPAKRVVDFPLERDTFRNKIKQIVEDFDEKSYNNNCKPWKSSRILRVNPNFLICLSFFIIFLHFFTFFIFHVFSCFSFHFSFFSFFHFFFLFFFFSFFNFSFFFIFFQFLSFSFMFFHFLSFSIIFYHFLSFSFSLLGAQNLIFFEPISLRFLSTVLM